MAAGDIDDALTNIPNVVLVDQSAASGAPGAGYGRLEVVNGVLGVRVGAGSWIPLFDLTQSGTLAGLTEKVAPGDTDLLLLEDVSDAGALKKLQVGNLPGGAGGGAVEAVAVYIYTVAQNTAGGTYTSGSFMTRPLNTEASDRQNIGTLASNQVTLGAGNYYFDASMACFATDMTVGRIYDVTHGTTLVAGLPAYAGALGAYWFPTRIAGAGTLAEQGAIEVQMRATTTQNTNGMGYPSNFQAEVYTVLVVYKLA